MSNFRRFGVRAALALSVSVGAAAAWAADVKIAFIDPLSGPFASTGSNGLNQYKFAADWLVNDKGGLVDGSKIVVEGFDNKASPQESLIQLQVAIDQGYRFIAQGNGSSVAHALTDAIDKHNRRNPDSRVLFLNYSAVDPALTNEDCNFWHFRFDANADIKMDVLTDVIAQADDLKKVYIIGQDYSFGKAVAAAANKMLAEKRPDIEIVGDELHPIGKVKDFTPYARKIVASEADAVITGNWGADMLGLGKSLVANGYSGPIYTYYAAGSGITAAFGDSGKDVIRLVSEGQVNPPPNDDASEYYNAFKARYPDGNVDQTRIFNVIGMLSAAIEQAGTTDDVVAIAKALEGMEYDSIWGSKLMMRPQDHQLIQDMHVQVHTNEGIDFDFDGSGFGTKVESTVAMAGQDSATTCEMKRP